MRGRRVRLVSCVLLALTIVLGACNGDGDGDDEAQDSTTTEATSTTTTTTEPPTTTVPIAGPEPWTDIVRDIWSGFEVLNADPDPSRVATIIGEDCDCYAQFVQGVQALADRGERVVGGPQQPVGVRPEGPTARGFQRLTVKVIDEPSQRLDATGSVIEEIPAAPTACLSILLAPSGPNGAHRIHDLFPIQQCPEEF
ncbi:MAG: hypothetical protein ACRD29_17390 [Acidimicrobiales bacterium]